MNNITFNYVLEFKKNVLALNKQHRRLYIFQNIPFTIFLLKI